MKLVLISGSGRPKSQSLKIGHWLTDKLEKDSPEVQIHPINVYGLDLTLDPNEYWDGKTDSAKQMKSIYGRFEEVDGFIVITPEWGGGVPPALRQLILMSGHSMSHKPVFAIGVSASAVGGIRPIDELKHATKNTRFVMTPDPLVINSVESVFNERGTVDPKNEHEKYLAKKLEYSLKVLYEYAKALKSVRESGVINHKDFPNGM